MTVCSGTLEHVELALLEGSELSSAVQAHLSTCSACSAEATALRALVLALSASPAPVAPAGLAARIVPLVLAEAQKGSRQGILIRAMRPVAAFASAIGAVVVSLAILGSGLVVYAQIVTMARPATPEAQVPPETLTPTSTPTTAVPATPAPTTAVPATPAPASEAPVESAEPEATPTPEPTDVPRRTPDPVSPEPSEGESTAPAESTSP